jgi:hypothetical protein
MRFSERYKYQQVREIIQIESVSDSLKNGLWNVLTAFAWRLSVGEERSFYNRGGELYETCVSLWHDFFRRPTDKIPALWPTALEEIRKYYFSAAWFAVYDFVEFMEGALPYGTEEERSGYIKACNAELERELSAYRFVGNVITRITEPEEIAAIENAFDRAKGPVRRHLESALGLLSDRKAPDYRNSIKESISAIESLVCLRAGEKGSLGQLLKTMQDNIGLHPALKNAFSNLYGYTSDEGGIRHAMLEASTLKLEDAIFFLVVCSAFISFVEAKFSSGPSATRN